MKISINSAIAFLFLIGAVLFFLSSIGGFLNYFFQFYPGKIAIEFLSTLFYTCIGIVIATLLFSLFWGLYKNKKWFINLYWLCSVAMLAYIFLTSSFAVQHLIKDLIAIGIISIITILLGIYFQKQRSHFSK